MRNVLIAVVAALLFPACAHSAPKAEAKKLPGNIEIQFHDGAEKSEFLVCHRADAGTLACFDYGKFHARVEEKRNEIQKDPGPKGYSL